MPAPQGVEEVATSQKYQSNLPEEFALQVYGAGPTMKQCLRHIIF